MCADLFCIGCGAKIQTTDKSIAGYVKPSLLENENLYCERCFKLKNYSISTNETKDPDIYLKVIQEISKEDALVISLVDIFDFSGSFISSIKRHTGQSDIILVGNKSDILPQSVKETKLIKFMRHMANLEGFKVLDCLLVSSKTGKNIDKLMDSIDKFRKNRNVYVVGCANVGKSSLINTIVKKYSDCKKDIITTSLIPGTTLGFINIPYEDSFIIDTPGLINTKQVINNLTVEKIKMITPKKEIKPMVYQLNEGQTVFMGGLASFDFIKGDKNSFVFYFANELYLHRTKTINKENLINTKFNDLLIPTFNDEYKSNEYEKTTFNILDDGKKYDIVISGLGFISVKGKASVSITTLKTIGVYLREAII